MNTCLRFFLFSMMSLIVTTSFCMDNEQPAKRRKIEENPGPVAESSSSSSSSTGSSRQSGIWDRQRERFQEEEKRRREKREKEEHQQALDRAEKEKKELEVLRQEQELLDTLNELFESLILQLEELSVAQSFAAINDVLEVVIEALAVLDISFSELKDSSHEEVRALSLKLSKIPALIVEKIENNELLRLALYVRSSVEKIDENLKAISTILGEPEVSISFDMNTENDEVEALGIQGIFDQEQDVADEEFARFVQEDHEQDLLEESRRFAEQLNRELNGH